MGPPLLTGRLRPLVRRAVPAVGLVLGILVVTGLEVPPRAGAAAPGGSPLAAQGTTTTTADPLIDSVGPALRSRGWYTQAGGGAESRALERLSRRLRADGSSWGLVALRGQPAQGTRSFAEDVLDDLQAAQSDISTVVVLTPSEVAAESRTYAGDTLDQAVTEAIPDFQRDVTAGYERLFQLLAGAPLTHDLAPLDPAAAQAPPRSKAPLFVAGGVLAVAAAVVLVVIGVRRAARS
jgi:hypothetical protein